MLTLVLVETTNGRGRGLVQVVDAERIPNSNGRVGRDRDERVVDEAHVPDGVRVAVEEFHKCTGRCVKLPKLIKLYLKLE